MGNQNFGNGKQVIEGLRVLKPEMGNRNEKTEKFTYFAAKLYLLFRKSEIRNKSQCFLKFNFKN